MMMMMSLRIVSGKFKGRVVQVPKGDGVRPTTGRVRQSVFSIIEAYLPQARVLDVFAGSGTIGLEALSRGASYVLAFEKEKQQASYIQRTIEQFKLSSNEYQLIQREALGVLKQGNSIAPPYDVVYLDPPYGFTQWVSLLGALQRGRWIASHSLVIVEQAPNDVLPPLAPLGLEEERLLPYGDTVVRFLGLASGEKPPLE
jgi:16S rRNA (guanine966-N2)-methyltransferase